MSRRAFLEGTSTALVVAGVAPAARAQSPTASPAEVPGSAIRVTVNGTIHTT